MKHRTLCLSRLTAEALGGYPVRATNRDPLRLLPPTDVLPDGEENQVLILDELTSAASDTLAAAQEVLLARRIGSERYPHVYPVAVCNDAAIAANGVDLPAPTLNRCLVYRVSDCSAWFDWARGSTSTDLTEVLNIAFEVNVPLLIVGPPGIGKTAAIEAWAGAHPGTRSKEHSHDSDRASLAASGILEYLRAFPDMTLQLPRSGEIVAWPSPRSWTIASRLPHDHMALAVGEAAAASFLEWRGANLDLPLTEMSEAERIDAAVRWVQSHEAAEMQDYPDYEWLNAHTGRIAAVAKALREREEGQ